MSISFCHVETRTGGARISSQDGVSLRLDAAGTIVCQTSVTEQREGAEAVTAQVVATVPGVKLSDVRVMSGDTDVTPYGGGTWARRAAGIGSKAAWQAGKQLRLNILEVAARILQTQPAQLDIRDGRVVGVSGGTERLTLAEVARIPYFRAARVSGRADGNETLCAARISVRVHRRHPGRLFEGRSRHRCRAAAQRSR
ncbi:MAG: molybdopterin-dependent oxidoreductase [Rhodopila sp.]|nr:molybdopterin-dependent oxidoreductase [Rhodopila sp.]